MALRVPSSRTRLLTDERVSRAATRKAEIITTMARTPPRRRASLPASTSDPEMLAANSLALVTVEPGKAVWMLLVRAPTSAALAARTSRTLARPSRLDSTRRFSSEMYTSAACPPSGGWASPTTVKSMLLRVSLSPGLRFFRWA